MSGELQVSIAHLPAMTDEAIAKVRELETLNAERQQVKIDTLHVIHAGVYSRTIMIPAGVLLTGALVKRSTLLVVSGDAIVYIGGETKELNGYNILPASANRKQAFVAKTDVWITMLFATDAKTVGEAEEEFTDEIELLFSTKDPSSNKIVITGE